ncbi:hypothetical protein DSL72_002606 [Monilinia vaccinii-corymbosi]|uniref:Methylated-DNA-[protein]-cysteine S-methyltransferase DNA binding domain-containing protein n=1 Tax=Monilinia vaccinii-corymbosi TaxID=61207 RepID=A0A8A3PD72_9HELO|nr:hypothetical protein DSL72_002606 [Monilinia vaccinii-corymbosi]
MPRTDEASAFYHSVYTAIQEIPYGKVTSYGHIARLIGMLGELSIDLTTYGWFPRQLPSEEAVGLDPPIDSSDEEELIMS